MSERLNAIQYGSLTRQKRDPFRPPGQNDCNAKSLLECVFEVNADGSVTMHLGKVPDEFDKLTICNWALPKARTGNPELPNNPQQPEYGQVVSYCATTAPQMNEDIPYLRFEKDTIVYDPPTEGAVLTLSYGAPDNTSPSGLPQITGPDALPIAGTITIAGSILAFIAGRMVMRGSAMRAIDRFTAAPRPTTKGRIPQILNQSTSTSTTHWSPTPTEGERLVARQEDPAGGAQFSPPPSSGPEQNPPPTGDPQTQSLLDAAYAEMNEHQAFLRNISPQNLNGKYESIVRAVKATQQRGSTLGEWNNNLSMTLGLVIDALRQTGKDPLAVATVPPNGQGNK